MNDKVCHTWQIFGCMCDQNSGTLKKLYKKCMYIMYVHLQVRLQLINISILINRPIIFTSDW